MKLCYRGVEYDYNPPSLEVTEREILGRYRGRTMRFSYVQHIPFPQPVAQLQYRGADYATNAQGQRETLGEQSAYGTPALQTSSANPAASPTARARRQLLQEASRVHRENMQRSLKRRLSIAQAQGNSHLVQQLEQEMHQIA